MDKIIAVIEKVAATARKAVLFGALVGGVSMVSYATETTETNVGPTKDKVEAAKLQTVQQSLNAVVDAIKKVDPNWVKGLPVVNVVKDEETLHWYIVTNDQTVGSPIFEKTRTEAMDEGPCDPGDNDICLFGSEDDNLVNAPVDTSNPNRLIRKNN